MFHFPNVDTNKLCVADLEASIAKRMYSDRVPLTLCPRNTSTMAAEFANTNGHRLLLGNEAGDVTLVDCRRQSGDTTLSMDLQAYPDAIFDVTWRADDANYALAVGDMHVYVHDSQTLTVQHCLGYHDSSVRTVRYRPNHPNTLATAGRDGCIALWDLRATNNNSTRNQPISLIEEAHSVRGGKHERYSLQTSPSVTFFKFFPLEDHLLCSIGQPDYSIRFWDIRYTRKKGQAAVPLAEISPSITGRRSRAFTSLCTDSLGSHLYAVSSDNHIYKYLSSNFSLVETLSAPEFRTSGSFYIRSTVSPDDNFLLCGSTEGAAFIWPTAVQRRKVFKLYEHRYEVSCVAWSSTNEIFVGGEDYVSRIWRADGENFNVDPVRHVRIEEIPTESAQSLHLSRSTRPSGLPRPLEPELIPKPKPFTWEHDIASMRTINVLGPWPLRSSLAKEAVERMRVPFANLINQNVSSTTHTPTTTPKKLGTTDAASVRKRQSILDSFFTPSKQPRVTCDIEK